MKARLKEPKPPKIPRCLCGSWLHYILGIASPSKYFDQAAFPTNAEAVKYFDKLNRYEIALIEYRIANRTCTRQEWDDLRRRKWIAGLKGDE